VREPVKIPKELIEKLKPFGPRFIKVSKPILGDKKSGKGAIEKDWPNHPYEADDPELVKWLEGGGNYGFILGRGLYALDLDDPELQTIFEDEIDTFTLQSGGKVGRHYLIMSDSTDNATLLSLLEETNEDEKRKNLGNLQVRNKYVVGPGSKHFSGGTYKILKDSPFAWVDRKKLFEIFGKHLVWTGQTMSSRLSQKETSNLGFEIPIDQIIDMSKLRQISDQEWQGSHPIHGSDSGTNFCVNKVKNCWHCFRCNSGGGPLSWLAVKNKLIRCDQAQKAILRGKLLQDTLDIAEKLGFKKQEMSKEEKQKLQKTCGENLENFIFEQISDEAFLIYNKTSGETQEASRVDNFIPWPKMDKLIKPVTKIAPFNCNNLWFAVKQYLKDHLEIIDVGYTIMTAWIFATWVVDLFNTVPYMFFFGPHNSGKTWALKILSAVVFRPFRTGHTSMSSIFRVCDAWHPTLILDETEDYMKHNRSDIINILNSGYTRGFPAVRVEEAQEGFEIRTFDCFGFKALAGTEEFVPTLKSRCITFNMSKNTGDYPDEIDYSRGQSLREQLLMLRFQAMANKIKFEKPPSIFKSRLRELLTPLLMVAPESEREKIIRYGEELTKITQEEERSSDDAIIFRVINKIIEENPQITKISIREIAGELNMNLPLGETYSHVKVGRTCARLGFQTTRIGSGRGIRWTKMVLERLKLRFGSVKSVAISF